MIVWISNKYFHFSIKIRLSRLNFTLKTKEKQQFFIQTLVKQKFIKIVVREQILN